jgi:thymidylate kinase
MKIIALEGIDGCGKSTLIRHWKHESTTAGRRYDNWVFGEEPSPYTSFGSMTREFLHGNHMPGSNELPKEALLALMMLSRFELLSAISIVNETHTGDELLVILDRYVPST